MDEQTVKRRLCAILSADVQGYSRLMGLDEVETIRTSTAYRGIMAERCFASTRNSPRNLGSDA